MDISEAHAKYGHISEQALCATMQLVHVKPTGKLRSCDGCAMTKAKAKVSKVSTTRATIAGELRFVDVSGPYKKSIFFGSNYWILFVNDYSSKSWSYFCTRKSDLPEKAEELLLK